MPKTPPVIKEKPKPLSLKDKFKRYCEDNPEAPECRVYEN